MTPCYCSLMRMAARRLSAFYDEAFTPLGINVAQYALLQKIRRLQPVSLTELGRESDLDRSTISRNARVLERMALVETGRGEADQRESVVRLTEQGERTLEQASPLWEARQREAEARLGVQNLDALREILRLL